MIRLLTLIVALALLASFAGALHPAGDSLAVFRPVLAVLLLIGAWSLPKGWRLAVSLAALAALVPILWSLHSSGVPGGRLVVYQKNLLFTLTDPAPLVTDITDSGADIVMLEEVSARNRAVPGLLIGVYPHQHICDAHTVGGVAILSRHPFAVPPECAGPRGYASARIATPAGEVTAAVLHLHWPYPFGQAAHVRQLLPVLEGLPRPVVVAGDFNMVPWGHATRAIAHATGTDRVGPLRESFRLKQLYPMAIDHVLMPRGWAGRAEMRPRLGSDHRGILARVAPGQGG